MIWNWRLFWKIVLPLSVAVIVIVLLGQAPGSFTFRALDASKVVWSLAGFLVIAWFVTYAGASFFDEAKKKGIRDFLGLFLAFMVALPVIGLVQPHIEELGIGGEATVRTVASCGKFSPDRTNSCLLDEGSQNGRLFTADRALRKDEYQFCIWHADGAPGYGSEHIGPNTYRLWSRAGTLLVTYRLMPSCPIAVPG